MAFQEGAFRLRRLLSSLCRPRSVTLLKLPFSLQMTPLKLVYSPQKVLLSTT